MDRYSTSVPTVSIGMPVFNDACFVREALDSLLTQTFSDFELIISDDCSNDGSQDICLEYANIDKRVRYIRQSERLGIQRNMEFLLNEARGEYFMWASDDDIWEPSFINNLLEPLQSDSNLIMSFCPYSFVDINSQSILSMERRDFDYSSKKPLNRLIKLCYFYDDGCGYGLFRKKDIEDVHYPVWRWVNRTISLNNIYPPLFFFLSRGNFKLVGSKVLFRKRIKQWSNHSRPLFNNKMLNYFAYLLRKLNVWWESLLDIYRGSKSLYLPFSLFLFVTLRLVVDCVAPLLQKISIFHFIKNQTTVFDKSQ